MPKKKKPDDFDKVDRRRLKSNNPKARTRIARPMVRVPPTKWSRKLENDLCENLRLGMPLNTACRCVGLSEETFNEWMAAGRERQSPVMATFSIRMDQATAQFISDNLNNIKEHSKKNWTASGWLLERMVPGQPFAVVTRAQVQVADTTVKDAALRQAEQAALTDRIADCPYDHPEFVIECEPPRDHHEDHHEPTP